MKHGIAITLLSLGIVGGVAAGFRSVRHRHSRHTDFERHVAELCVKAAEGARPSGPTADHN
jgi:hypothetical protein